MQDGNMKNKLLGIYSAHIALMFQNKARTNLNSRNSNIQAASFSVAKANEIQTFLDDFNYCCCDAVVPIAQQKCPHLLTEASKVFRQTFGNFGISCRQETLNMQLRAHCLCVLVYKRGVTETMCSCYRIYCFFKDAWPH